MSAVELDLAASGLRLLLDGVEVDAVTGEARLARIALAPSAVGPALDVGAAFRGPAGIAAAPDGDVFVADPAGDRILRIPACATDAEPIRCLDLAGPRGVTVDARGRLVVADTGHERVVAFDRATFQTLLVIDGLAEPWELAADSTGGLYVVEHGRATVRAFDLDGDTDAVVYAGTGR